MADANENANQLTLQRVSILASSLADLLSGIAASASILFGHVACTGLTLTLAALASICLR